MIRRWEYTTGFKREFALLGRETLPVCVAGFKTLGQIHRHALRTNDRAKPTINPLKKPCGSGSVYQFLRHCGCSKSEPTALRFEEMAHTTSQKELPVFAGIFRLLRRTKLGRERLLLTVSYRLARETGTIPCIHLAIT